MADSMKRPPMQKQAERLAAQGRYGDSMLVHMNPAEVQGIASLVPGGQLPTNPQTGQPEAFPWLLAAKIAATAAGALKGRKDAKKASKRAQKATAAIEARREPFDEFSAQKIREAAGSSALGIGRSLEDVKDPSNLSFLPPGVSSDWNFDYQNTPGAIFANYQPSNPFERGPIQDPIVVDEEEESVVVTPPPDVPPDEWYPEKPLEDLPPYFDQYPIAQINADLESRGMPKLETLEDIEDYMQEAERRGRSGMPPLMLPFTMADGGIMSALSNFGRGIGQGVMGAARGIGKLGGTIKDEFQAYNAAQQENQSKGIEEMTREELIEYIKSGGKSSPDSSGGTLDVIGREVSNSSGGDLGALRDFISSAAPSFSNSISAANGGEIQYPRMGGQISGPGTERSDDIPAMLSDGEFVVNARGLRGLGKINGANGSKADQRREGARTMYALQRAGEQAMRRS